MQHLPYGHALTLSDGQDQVPFFTEALVELRRPEEAVPEGSEPSPSDGGLDSFLGRKVQEWAVLSSFALMNLPGGSVQDWS